MAKTKIADVIVPELFAPYVISRTKERSELIGSGIAVGNQYLDDLVTMGGRTVNMPFWKALSGSDEVLDDNTALTPEKIDAVKDVAPILIRGKAWSANELAGAMAGNDPMSAVGDQVADFWTGAEQKILISVLKGIFAAALADSHVNDISGKTGTAAVIGPEAVLDTKQLLGDAASQLSAIAMHSKVYTALQKQNLVEYTPGSEGFVSIPTYLGYRVLVDDGLPAASGVYYTYIFTNGAFGRGDGVPSSLTPAETCRNSLQSDDILISRRALCLHPFGVAWKNPVITSATPANTDLETGANWVKVYPDKAIGIALLKHKI